MNSFNYQNSKLREIFNATKVIRKPVTGIVSDYHELPYLLITPSKKDPSESLEISGKIKVSPKFILSAASLQESFGDVFDPETFNSDIEGRLFSFAYSNQKNLKVESEDFKVKESSKSTDELIDRAHDKLMQKEDIKTALISGPEFDFYPISLDRFINDILSREFRV